ncbi:MAG: hypothetical protein COV91_00295 [Candidatus Taylorbacteria bacterium CG11_big_fil_rev_8_21_14_0_20_46_11]|uniref:Zinc finger DksA/TraR C4-type domain-containing protein n=1 Tax=Candidatus Taylorbacteria bacterium CG11_big_fil_rev_8_21_14_0_20_46_11 TaxID=1975025 RepID=A0A2H0KD19_9BACT|nr:MAG: hypothetical protein COV91_00295 [Candidatus Taylorbacteria bacterium CG11_big_fil_rev_8_21_14_0_20_46_11]
MTIDTTIYKEKLLEEKVTLEAELATVGRKSTTVAGDWEPVASESDRPAERDEVADKLESFEENVAIVRQLESRLGEVTSALAQIENGGYGICTVCQKEIEADRLEANPGATTCKEHLK